MKPNSMQVRFITNLRNILEKQEKRALLISATGTGKTYASAFAMRELGFKRVLFLVHRASLALQARKSYEKVFGSSITTGLVGGGFHDYDKDYVFATVETLNKDAHLQQYKPDEFDCIILDEAHHSSANTYQRVMNYFKPRLFLGMTATPDKRDDLDGNIYEIFHYQIAYEIRLQQAMEEDLLCPFHYFGISDLSVVQDTKTRKLSGEDFDNLVCGERVRHIIEQAEYYGYSGERVKGLIFCSRKQEYKELSNKFNALGYRTVALSGEDSEEVRQDAFERLAMNVSNETEKAESLDYIFSVDILNDGWEFPGGKIETGESPRKALIREIKEELNADISVGELIDTVEFDYPQFHLSMDCFWCILESKNVDLNEHEDARWLTKKELGSVEWLPADAVLIDNISQCL